MIIRKVCLAASLALLLVSISFSGKPVPTDTTMKSNDKQVTGGNMKLKLHEIELYSKNLDESKKFYADILGLNVKIDQKGLKVFDSGVSQALDFNCSQHFESKKNAFSFLVRDVDEFRKELIKKGMNIPEPKDAHLGMRTIRFEDPDGNIIIINSPTEKSPSWLKSEIN